jgi:cysteinyl-tRNA synthetase
MLRLYNSLTRKKEEFAPIKKTARLTGGPVGLYACGPTVYSHAHIGNFRSFIFEDTLRRVLEYFGYKVRAVMNVTDVGHLSSDADTGEDKLAAAAARERKTAWEVADFYTQAFLRDAKLLNILPPTMMPRATAHIKEQIALIKELEKKSFTYKTNDGIYFDTSKLASYGKLSGQRGEEKAAGKRVALGEKRRPTDFALWKFSPRGERRDMEWPSPWGVGFPGWHIECSAMSRKYLGQPFDIHAGGVDHLPVHHENEIAQSEAAYGKPLARFWLHGEYLILRGDKISKSKGNFITIDELIKRGFDPLAFRYLLFGAHYRKPLTFSWEALESAQNALTRLRSAVRNWDRPRAGCAEFEKRFAEAIADDLNMPKAISVVWEMINSKLPTAAKAKSILKFDKVLGLGLDKCVAKPIKIPVEIKKLLAERAAARQAKNWKESDRLRDLIAEKGFLIEDTKEGQAVTAGGEVKQSQK